ncbi:unnamed protein product [Prunus armeniaca]
MGLRFLLDLGCLTCVNAGLLFTLLHITNLTSLLSSLIEILENSYCLSKRGVVVHPKASWGKPGWLSSCQRLAVSGNRGGAGARRWTSCSLSSQPKNVSPLRKKPKLPYAEKTQVGSIPLSSAGVKHLVGADSRKVGGTRSA